jgi:hypothetical protein
VGFRKKTRVCKPTSELYTEGLAEVRAAGFMMKIPFFNIRVLYTIRRKGMDFGLQKNYKPMICLHVTEYYLIMNPHVIGNFVTRKITMATAAIAKEVGVCI